VRVSPSRHPCAPALGLSLPPLLLSFLLRQCVAMPLVRRRSRSVGGSRVSRCVCRARAAAARQVPQCVTGQDRGEKEVGRKCSSEFRGAERARMQECFSAAPKHCLRFP